MSQKKKKKNSTKRSPGLDRFTDRVYQAFKKTYQAYTNSFRKWTWELFPNQSQYDLDTKTKQGYYKKKKPQCPEGQKHTFLAKLKKWVKRC